MTYKVIQWATGGVGRAAVQGILDHPELELVGCWVSSEDKAGRDVGEICGGAANGIIATNDADALLELDADCVMYSPIMADPELVQRILASGKNVVTPLNWFYPGKRDVAALEAACAAGNSTLHGTGIHPGGVTERFPLMVSALSNAITHVRAEEFSDIRTYGAPGVISDIMLFGKTPEAAAASPMVQFLGDGFGQSMEMVADELGFAVDPDPVTRHEVAVATQPIDSPIGVIEPGRVAAQRFTWQRTVRGEPVITVRVNWFMGDHVHRLAEAVAEQVDHRAGRRLLRRLAEQHDVADHRRCAVGPDVRELLGAHVGNRAGQCRDHQREAFGNATRVDAGAVQGAATLGAGSLQRADVALAREEPAQRGDHVPAGGEHARNQCRVRHDRAVQDAVGFQRQQRVDVAAGGDPERLKAADVADVAAGLVL